MKRLSRFNSRIYPLVAFMILLAAGCTKNGNLPTVTTAPVTRNTASTATGGGEVTDEGGSTVTARGVCWSAFEDPTTSDSKTIDGEGTGAFTSQLSGLSADKIYYARAYATNSDGTAYGSGVSFTTAVSDSTNDEFTDARDGRKYKTLIIGVQTWMAENLAYLPAVSGPGQGSEIVSHYYVYDCDSGITVNAARDSANYKTYGVLYNWPAAMKSCPAGWHLPSDTEWDLLMKTIGAPVGGKMKLKGLEYWKTPNTGATNSSGFTALPAGQRYSLGEYRFLGEVSVFWSSTFRNDATAWSWHLFHNKDNLSHDYFSKSNGFSVRCIRN
jgi:uncharacterized protein (TIGR02145 family)